MTNMVKTSCDDGRLRSGCVIQEWMPQQKRRSESFFNTGEKSNSTIGMELGFVLMQCYGRLRRDLDQGQRLLSGSTLKPIVKHFSGMACASLQLQNNRSISGWSVRTRTTLDQPVFLRSSKGMRLAMYAADPNKTTLRCEVTEHA